MEEFLGGIILFPFVFIINGIVLYIAMQITGVSAYFSRFLILNTTLALPAVFLPPLYAIAVSTVLFWILVFKCTDVDSAITVFMMIFVMNAISFMALLKLGHHATQYAQSNGTSFFADASYADTDEEEEEFDAVAMSNSALDLSQLRIKFPAANGSLQLQGSVRNKSEQEISFAMISYDYKTNGEKGFGSYVLGSFLPGQERNFSESLNGARLPTSWSGPNQFNLKVDRVDF